ncbi:PQQ-dependent sugar dehydrogenase [Cyclobacterium plantarum]|uniref:PQQ-dependent sugar dehydrogenase n=1 Tax=Cyclobacterium plantarum TaxID=2716263 RepID=UPI003F6F1A03
MKSFFVATCILISLFVFNACVQEDPVPDPTEDRALQLVEAFPNLSFNRPLDIQHPGDGSDRLFVVEQRGVVTVFPNQQETGEKSTFLNLVNQVNDTGNEEGLLGLAFHPDYASNGFFYVNYTASNPARTVISRFQVSESDPDQADPQSEMVLLEIDQPYTNHNGGKIAFGPDGYLYVSVGDGGSGGDPQGNGQNRATLLGSILRIDIDASSSGKNYGIPADNPFVGNEEGFREEIYAYMV